MPSNPVESEWYSTPRDKRKRKGVEVTLSPEARKELDALAKGSSMSRVIEAWLLRSAARRKASR